MTNSNNIPLVSNPFCSILDFYYKYRRSMLTNDGLSKLFKKYDRNKAQLLADIKRKYGDVDFQDKFPAIYICKLLDYFGSNECIKSYFPECHGLLYEAKYDPSSPYFDPLSSLQNKKFYSFSLNAPIFDNISKLKVLINDPMTNLDMIGNKNNDDCPSVVTPGDIQPCLSITRIIELTILPNQNHDIMNCKMTVGPLTLLKRYYDEKIRVRVLIRRRRGVRCILYGYIKAFDKHFNLFLHDVDEIYPAPSCEFPLTHFLIRKEVMSITCSSDGTCNKIRKRHLSQLIVRGDNVVIVSAAVL